MSNLFSNPNIKNGCWRKGGCKLSGWWQYLGSDRFRIEIRERDPLTGRDTRTFTVYGDTPEWNGWKLIRLKESEVGDE